METIVALAEQLGYQVTRNIPMSRCTTFKIGGPAAVYITLSDTSRLPELLRCCRQQGVPVYFTGNGSNLLVSDEGIDGVVIRLMPEGQPTVQGTRVVCPAGLPLKRLCLFARDQGLSGLEFAYGIPGTVGGALYMNAGAYGGEMADVVVSAEMVSERGAETLPVDQLQLGYRQSTFMERPDTLITAVTFQLTPDDPKAIGDRMEYYMQCRRDKQPLEFPSAGSYFKRPPGHYASKLIQDCGLKGYAVGGAQISEKHAGFIINCGGATCADVLELERRVREIVLERTGVTLQREVRLIQPVQKGDADGICHCDGTVRGG